MPIQLQCSGCGRPLSAPGTAAGKQIRCPGCQAVTTVETPSQAAVSAPSPPQEPPRPAPKRRKRKVKEARNKPFAKPGFFARLFGKATAWSQEERDWMHRVAMDEDNVELRLDFADWLMERGHSLGEMIWLDYEIDQLPDDSEDFEAFNDRRNELLGAPAEQWFDPLRPLGLRPMLAETFYPVVSREIHALGQSLFWHEPTTAA